MTGDPRTEHDRDLERVAEAYRRLAGEEPPALVDQAVLNRARRASATRTARPWNFGWVHALTTTAIVVLGVALLMQRPPEAPQEPMRVARPPSAKLRDIEAEVQPLSIPAQQAARLRPAPAAVTETRRQAEAGAERERSVSGVSAQDKGEQLAVAAEVTARVAGASLSSDRPAARLEEQDLAAPESEAMAPTGADETARMPPPDPARWIERLLELRRQGNDAAFETELAAFRLAFPDHPLPPELAD